MIVSANATWLPLGPGFQKGRPFALTNPSSTSAEGLLPGKKYTAKRRVLSSFHSKKNRGEVRNLNHVKIATSTQVDRMRQTPTS